LHDNRKQWYPKNITITNKLYLNLPACG
jgi:hypothetical protein